jgi:hypothetical protein
VIDPRALQQHFKKIHQRQEPDESFIPRISNSKPLTAIKAVQVLEPIIEQEELTSQVAIPVNLVIDVPPPIGDLFINEIEEEEPIKNKEQKEVLEVEKKKEKIETRLENPYGYSTQNDIKDDYNPYEYYSGPRF